MTMASPARNKLCRAFQGCSTRHRSIPQGVALLGMFRLPSGIHSQPPLTLREWNQMDLRGHERVPRQL